MACAIVSPYSKPAARGRERQRHAQAARAALAVEHQLARVVVPRQRAARADAAQRVERQAARRAEQRLLGNVAIARRAARRPQQVQRLRDQRHEVHAPVIGTAARDVARRRDDARLLVDAGVEGQRSRRVLLGRVQAAAQVGRLVELRLLDAQLVGRTRRLHLRDAAPAARVVLAACGRGRIGRSGRSGAPTASTRRPFDSRRRAAAARPSRPAEPRAMLE